LKIDPVTVAGPRLQEIREAFGRYLYLELVEMQQGADSAAIAASPAPDSRLANRIQHFGKSPCAFVLTGAAAFRAERPSIWAGRTLSWLGDAKLGLAARRAAGSVIQTIR
jgi:hypothetical protein